MVNNLKPCYCRMRCLLQFLKITVRLGIEAFILVKVSCKSSGKPLKIILWWRIIRYVGEMSGPSIAFHLVCTGTVYQWLVLERLGARFWMCLAGFLWLELEIPGGKCSTVTALSIKYQNLDFLMAPCKNRFWYYNGLFIGFSVDNGRTEITMGICCYFRPGFKVLGVFSLPNHPQILLSFKPQQ